MEEVALKMPFSCKHLPQWVVKLYSGNSNASRPTFRPASGPRASLTEPVRYQAARTEIRDISRNFPPRIPWALRPSRLSCASSYRLLDVFRPISRAPAEKIGDLIRMTATSASDTGNHGLRSYPPRGGRQTRGWALHWHISLALSRYYSLRKRRSVGSKSWIHALSRHSIYDGIGHAGSPSPLVSSERYWTQR